MKYSLYDIKKSINRTIENMPSNGKLKYSHFFLTFVGTLIEDFDKMVNSEVSSDCSFQVENKIFHGHKIMFLW